MGAARHAGPAHVRKQSGMCTCDVEVVLLDRDGRHLDDTDVLRTGMRALAGSNPVEGRRNDTRAELGIR
jgi:hypothetical protein